MKFVKFRKTNLNLKIVLTILLLNLSFSGFSQIDPSRLLLEQNLPTQLPTQGTTIPTRMPVANEPTIREMVADPEDAEAMAKEEERKKKLEAEIAADEERERIIKRTFGSSLFSKTTFEINQAINIPTPNNYVLGPGDKLKVSIWGNLNMEETVVIDPDGYVFLNRGELVEIGGLNIIEAENAIKKSLSKKYPSISAGLAKLRLSLTGFRTIKIKVQGDVVAPGAYTATSFTDLMGAIYLSGGPNEIGTYRDIKLIRNNQVIASLDIYDFLTNGFSNQNLLLKDQDIVFVGPFQTRVAVEGATKRRGLFEIKPDDKVSDLIKYAGGFNQNAFTELVKIYRNTKSERKIVNINESNYNTEGVFTGDSLVVEKVSDRIGNLITIEGAVYREGEFSLDYNPTLSKLIESAGGLKEESLEGRINIFRTNEDLSISNISLNYFDIRNRNQADIELKRFDRIVVPSIFELTEQAYVKIKGAINHEDGKEGVELPFVKDMSIQDVLVQVGGLTEAASLSRVEIVRRKRNIDPKVSDAQIAEIIPFKIRPDLSLEEPFESVDLMPYDEIIIRNSPNYEEQKFITIRGEIMYEGEYGIEYKDQRVSDIISRAGGLTDLAYLKGAKLFRKTLMSEKQREKREETLRNLNLEQKVKETEDIDSLKVEAKTITTEGIEADSYINDEIGLDFEKILSNPGNPKYDMILQDGDEIIIPKRLETVRIDGEVLYPNSAKYIQGKTFLSYITEAGGFTKKSAKGNAIVVYPNGSVDRTRKFFFIRFYPKIEPGSEILVPAKSDTAIEQISTASGFLSTISTTLMTVVSIFTILRLR